MFDVSKNIASVPPFRASEGYFDCNAFEKISTALEWSREMYAVPLQCKLIGKQEVVSSLSTDDGRNYKELKKSMFEAAKCLRLWPQFTFKLDTNPKIMARATISWNGLYYDTHVRMYTNAFYQICLSLRYFAKKNT